MASVLKSILAACAMAAVFAPGASMAQREDVVRAGEIWFEALPPQQLPSGRCGLFLWARSAQPVFVLVAYDTPNAAYVRANGRERALERTAFEGDRVHGQFERQTFSDGHLTLDVDLTFDERRPVRDGAIVEHGVIRVVGEEGWQTIVPVGGMVACQT